MKRAWIHDPSRLEHYLRRLPLVGAVGNTTSHNILFGESLGGPTDDTAWTPSVDVYEETDRFLLSADMPGIEAKDIEVSAEDCVLTIRAERLARARADSDSVENVKSVSGTFLRRVTLPVAAQAEVIKASYANGVLEIEIPKQARVETRRIPVTVN